MGHKSLGTTVLSDWLLRYIVVRIEMIQQSLCILGRLLAHTGESKEHWTNGHVMSHVLCWEQDQNRSLLGLDARLMHVRCMFILTKCCHQIRFQVLMHQIRWRPGPRHDAPPDRLIGWGRDTPTITVPARRCRRLAQRLQRFDSASHPPENGRPWDYDRLFGFYRSFW